MKRLVPFCLAFAFAAHADEGMWTLDNFPAKKVRQKYGFSPDAEWLQEARLASVRLAEQAKAAGVRRFAFASSCSNYGAAGNEPVDEEAHEKFGPRVRGQHMRLRL